MVKVNRINTSQIEGGYSDDSDKRPNGEMALYNDDNGGFDLVIHDGVNSTNLNKVLGKGKLYGHGADSADGNGYDTIKLIPDIPAYNNGSNQYLIIDPTGPNHVHIRAGGTIDNSNSELILGGENSYVKIGAFENPPVFISSNSNDWTFGIDGSLTVPGVLQNSNSFQIQAGTAPNTVEFLGQIDNGFGDGPGATLHVTSMIYGTITDGMTIYGEGLPAEGWTVQFGTVMEPQGNGGIGNYYLPGANYLTGSQLFNNGDAANSTWTFGTNSHLSIPGNITFTNNSTVATGTFDNGTGGNNGISLNCVVGYELNWQGGHLKNTDDGGLTAVNILADSAIEFPGSGIDNMEINSVGLIFSDGTTQNTAASGIVSDAFNTDLVAGTGISLSYDDNLDTLTILTSGVAFSDHTHTASDITDFSSSVSGLLPVKDIISGTNISITSVSGVYTVNSTVTSVDQAASVVTTVFNETGSQIPKMTAVYIDGGHGDRPTVSLALATGDPTSAGTYGVTLENIDNMELGQAIVFGALTGVNTDPAHGGIAGATEGSTLYLSPTTPGGLTTTKPSAPNHIVVIGTVVRVHQNEGVIEVRIQNGFELDELHNVAISGATNGQFLQYNSSSQLWVPTSSGNFTTLQVSGTNVSVSGHTHTASNITDFNSAVSGLLPSNIVTGSGLTNHIAYWNSSGGIVADSGQLYWDASNNRLGIGTVSPGYALDVVGNVRFGANGPIQIIDTGAGNSRMVFTGAGSVDCGTNFTFRNNAGNVEYARIDTAGRLGVGINSPTSTLHVTGDFAIDNIKIDANTISSTNSNGNIVLAPSGTGDVQVDADTLRVGDSNSAATITSNGTGNLTISTNSGTNSGSIVINQGVNGNIGITPNGTGEVDISKVDIDGGSIDNTIIGATSAASGKFTQLYPTVVSNGTVSGSVSTNVANGQIFDMTVSGATTLSNPTNAVDGVTVRWRITQDGTGGHSVSLDTEFQIPSSASSPLPWSTAANATDILAATYHAGRGKWDVVAFVPGY